MKKLLSLLGCALISCALLFTSCSPSTSSPSNTDNSKTPEKTVPKDNSVKITEIAEDEFVSSETTEEDGTYYKVTARDSWTLASLSLEDFSQKTIDITFSAKMKIASGTTPINLNWKITAVDKDNNPAYPEVASYNFTDNEWVTVTGSASNVILNEYPFLYIAKPENIDNLVIYIKDVEAKVTVKNITWLDSSVPSLYETYKDFFDYFGFAVEYTKEVAFEEVRKGLVKHANTISLGNEFKPDFIFDWGWWNVNEGNLANFTASNGKTIKVPSTIPTFKNQDEIFKLCKTMNMHMRGHVLLWHSQTPEQFFRTNYKADGALVSADEMDARLEWYIKTVVQHCDAFKLSDGTPIIWAWDVANEATSDNSKSDAATSSDYTHWLRTEGSNWYTIYKNAEAAGKENYYTGSTYKAYDFVVNAFRFANKYANPKTQLVYNDYGGLNGTNTSAKHDSQLRLVQLVLDHKNDASFPTRIDAMGLQSHYSIKNSTAAYEKEITDFVKKGLDVQITELDIASCESYNPVTDTVGASNKQFNSVADAYKSFMTMFIKNRKTDSNHGINCVTIWGITDEQTWLNSQGQRMWIGNCDQYPLLFTLINSGASQRYTVEYNDGTYQDTIPVANKPATKPSNVVGYYEMFDEGDSYKPKNAFYAVIDAAKNYNN